MMPVATLERTSNTAVASSARLYFVHIPKTAGITVGRFLGNHYPLSDTLIIDEWDARALPAEEVERHSLFSGHYSSEVLEKMGERPLTVTLIREPMGRFNSWAVHCRRVSHRKYRDMFEGKTDLDVVTGPDGYTCRQAHWLARALRTGADDTTVPTSADLPGLLAEIDIVGITSEVERFMQLVSFRMGWAPPPRGWHVNKRPGGSDASRTSGRTPAEDAAIERELDIDAELHAMATAQFWNAYAAMLDMLCPDGETFTPASAAAVPLDTVQDWLRVRYADVVATSFPHPASAIEISADDALCGEGWFWRSGWDSLDDRWTGPETRSTWSLPRLVPNRDYDLTIDVLWPATPDIWEQTTVIVNGHRLDVRRDIGEPAMPRGATHFLRALVPAELVSERNRLTHIAIEVPETVQALKNLTVCESFDTYNKDERFVGLSVQRLSLRPA